MKILEKLKTIVGGESQFEVIERIVDHVLPNRDQKLVPVGLKQICKDKEIVLAAAKLGTVGYRGKFNWTKAGTPRITLQEDNNYKRQNFTLAHELGHWMTQTMLPYLQHESYRLNAERTPDCEEERLADDLAFELLMPRREFNETAARQCTLRELDAICSYFQVERTVAMRRMAMLSNKTLLYAVLIPTLPNKLDSLAVVDEAWLAEESGSLVRLNDGIETAEPVLFSQLSGNCRLAFRLDTAIESIEGECDYVPSNYPSVHIYGSK